MAHKFFNKLSNFSLKSYTAVIDPSIGPSLPAPHKLIPQIFHSNV